MLGTLTEPTVCFLTWGVLSGNKISQPLGHASHLPCFSLSLSSLSLLSALTTASEVKSLGFSRQGTYIG